MAGSIAEAEDLTQQAFLQAYATLDTFRGESSFCTTSKVTNTWRFSGI
jgi:DNA-directed RNA polymerase specialized sigma24 family protein